jgi:hypothetical protein
MAKNYMKNYSTLKNENQNIIEIPSRVRMAIVKKTNNKCWQGCGGKRTLNTAGGSLN